MSIQEAIERGPLSRSRRIIDSEHGDDAYDRLVLAEGWSLLVRSRVVKLLRDHKDQIGEGAKFVGPKILGLDKASFSLNWDYRSVEENGPEICNSVRVEARPQTNELVIWANIEAEILGEAQWYEELVLEDALARAFKDPCIMPVVEEPDGYEDLDAVLETLPQDES